MRENTPADVVLGDLLCFELIAVVLLVVRLFQTADELFERTAKTQKHRKQSGLKSDTSLSSLLPLQWKFQTR